VQFAIDLIHENNASSIRISGACQSVRESIEPVAAAFATGPVTCGERNSFVKEKQFSVKARKHHGAPPIFKFQEARYPTPTGVMAYDLSIVVVEHAAPVAHERATRGDGQNRATGIYAVLQWHSRDLTQSFWSITSVDLMILELVTLFKV